MNQNILALGKILNWILKTLLKNVLVLSIEKTYPDNVNLENNTCYNHHKTWLKRSANQDQKNKLLISNLSAKKLSEKCVFFIFQHKHKYLQQNKPTLPSIEKPYFTNFVSVHKHSFQFLKISFVNKIIIVKQIMTILVHDS
jgi:hypothetical protein